MFARDMEITRQENNALKNALLRKQSVRSGYTSTDRGSSNEKSLRTYRQVQDSFRADEK